MSQQLRKDAPLPYQADKRQSAKLAFNPLAVLPGVLGNAAGLNTRASLCVGRVRIPIAAFLTDGLIPVF